MQNHTTPLVLNWHLTEACNYRCEYCYATWDKSACTRELVGDSQLTSALLDELYRFFQPDNCVNPLVGRLAWHTVRLNLAGGEPLLYSSKLLSIIQQARALGFEVSMISNGSRLTPELLEQLAPQLTWLGISIDSATPTINRNIGRIDSRGQLLNLDDLANQLDQARQHNPDLHLKINTVVNHHNHDEDLSPMIRRFAPEKWKVLRMLPVVNQELAISGQQFDAFVARHAQLAHVLCAEDNQDMEESYLMIDPHGRFFQNRSRGYAEGYVYSKPILEVGVDSAFAQMAFNPTRFSARYIPTWNGEST